MPENITNNTPDTDKNEQNTDVAKLLAESMAANKMLLEKITGLEASQAAMNAEYERIKKESADKVAAEEAAKAKKLEEEKQAAKEAELKKLKEAEKVDVAAILQKMEEMSAAQQKALENLMDSKVSALEEKVSSSALSADAVKQLTAKQLEAAKVADARAELVKGLKFPELVSGNTIEELMASVEEQRKRESDIEAEMKASFAKQLSETNPVIARILSPSVVEDSPGVFNSNSYVGNRDSLKNMSKDEFKKAIAEQKRKLLSKGINI